MKKSKKQKWYNLARISLILVIFFSVLNAFLLPIIYSCSTFLATYLSRTTIYYGGTRSDYFTYVLLAIVTLVPFVLSTIFAKKHPVWMIIAFVYYAIDCIICVMNIPTSLHLDFYDGPIPLFLDMGSRIYVLITLFFGMKASYIKE
ncbi:MAG: hypothetical protein E7370_02160 [Clostridiales bacterium]|nr:hypothetical protein [Clostridiales bacterium]